MRTMKHFALATMAAAALALAGCGGGGSGTSSMAPTMPTTPTEPTTPTAAAVTLPSDGNMYLDEMDTTLADTTAPVMLATGEMHEVGAYMLTCTVGPCEITIADGEVMATGTVTPAYTAAAMATIDAAKMAKMDENSGRSLGMHSALTDATGTRGEAILGGTKDDDLEIMRGMSGGAMVTDGRLGGKSGWTGGMADRTVSGFEGHKLTRKTEKIVVYTDIAAAKHRSFLTHYAGAATAAIPDSTETITVQNDAAAANHGRLTLTTAAMAAAGNAGLLDPTKFPQPKDEGEGNNAYTYDNMEGASKKKNSFKGTFHGAPGTYRCGDTAAAVDCVVTVSDRSTSSEPGYTVAGSSWIFTPDTANNPQIVNQDGDHMHFGWWVNTPASAATVGQYLYDAEIFYGGSMPFNTSVDIIALDGDADYSGPAAGLFAVKGENAAHGEFTATATLTAKFGDTTAGATTGAEGGTISGKIASFVRDDGVANNWALTLGAAGIAAGGTPADDGKGSGLVTGGSNNVIGAWEFQMYGPTTAAKDPTGIAGAFRAAVDANTAVAGAFATK